MTRCGGSCWKRRSWCSVRAAFNETAPDKKTGGSDEPVQMRAGDAGVTGMRCAGWRWMLLRSGDGR